jgi:DNA-binding MarR family transcriptional regulator
VERLKKKECQLNELLVETFSVILQLEEKTIQQKDFKDLSIREIHALSAIAEGNGRSMSRMAASLGVAMSTVTATVDRICRKGYAKRIQQEPDRRKVQLVLTNRGDRVVRLHRLFHRQMVRAAIQDLDSFEQGVLIGSMSRLNHFFKDECRNLGIQLSTEAKI